MKSVCFGLGAFVAAFALTAPVLAAAVTPLDVFKARTDAFGCTVKGADITFHGDTGNISDTEKHPDLVTCVEGSGLKHIDHLYVTSKGGDAWRTLRFAQKYADRIDTVVVDGLCASSCANYIVPIAKHLVLRADSFVLVHGSINAELFRTGIAKAEKQALKGLDPKSKKAASVRATFTRSEKEAAFEVKTQAAFEAKYLSCRVWLHPNSLHLKHEAENTRGFIMQPSVFRTCLKRQASGPARTDPPVTPLLKVLGTKEGFYPVSADMIAR